MLVKARAVLADVAREHARTGLEVERLTDRIDRAASCHTTLIWAEIARPVMRRLGNHGKCRIGRVRIQPDIGIALVVLEEDVVLGLVFFDHRVFKHERFKLSFGHYDVKIVNMADQLARLGVQPFRRLKIIGHTVAQQLGLADVDHLACFIFVQVHARLHRQLAHAFLQLFPCRGKPPPRFIICILSYCSRSAGA